MTRKKASGSPTQRSAAMMRRHGYDVGITEKWNPHVRIRQDLFGFGDMIAFKEGIGSLLPGETILIQTTTRHNMNSRVEKIKGISAALRWLRAGNRIHVHGWYKLKHERRWLCEIISMTAADFDSNQPAFMPENGKMSRKSRKRAA